MAFSPFGIPFRRKPPPPPPKASKSKVKNPKGGTEAKKERPRLGMLRSTLSWPFMCGHCGALTDHPIRCAKCGVTHAMVKNPHYDPETAAALATAATTKKPGEMKLLGDILSSAYELPRIETGVRWFDRVIGGGIVPGKAYLIAGGPGTGKSTLLMQVLVGYAREDRQCLYVSGEEEDTQIAARAARVEGIEAKADFISMWSSRDTGEAAGAIQASKPSLVIVDSIQEIGDEDLETQFGGAKQVDNLMRLCIEEAKKVGAAIIFICQVTKSGDPAGPKRAEHLTDCNMKIDAIDYDQIDFEIEQPKRGKKKGDDDINPMEVEYRHFVCWKNRFSPANTQAVLKMTRRGLIEVEPR
jgi:predicted ATP-dependent serine protease